MSHKYIHVHVLTHVLSYDCADQIPSGHVGVISAQHQKPSTATAAMSAEEGGETSVSNLQYAKKVSLGIVFAMWTGYKLHIVVCFAGAPSSTAM